MLGKAQGLPADMVFLTSRTRSHPGETGCAQEHRSRRSMRATGRARPAVRVNDLTTSWTYRDVVEVVEGAGNNLDCIMLPKVQSAEQIAWLDLTLTQIGRRLACRWARSGSRARIRERPWVWSMRTPSRPPRRDRGDHLWPG
jgi:citrate lyase subunit beta/citryl-CoA lyase